VNQLLIEYSYLQLLDLMTTLAFMVNGVREGNPLVRFAIDVAPSPLAGLLAVKLVAILLGVYCWRMRRNRVLSRINVMFAALVAWNLVALIVNSVRGGA
jgi:hypothetical protein